VRAHAWLRIGSGGTVERLVDDPPIGWRVTPGAVYLVGTAGGPTGDDQVRLDVEVAPGARLAVRSSAATIVYAGTGTSQRIDAAVGAGGAIDWAPEPVVVTAGAHHTQVTRITADPSASIDWTELLVLGRHQEPPGRADLRLDCTLAGGRPLLRHRLQFGPGATGWDGPAVLGGHRTVALRLVAGPALAPPPRRQGEGWAWLDLEGSGWLLTAVAADLPTLLGALAAAGSPPTGDGMDGDGAGDPTSDATASQPAPLC
jgi:urease accessory protein